ncbi:unnamed protein product [Owenia fusiformis]|uniref:Uncharacterized protein n=1 Tax=Owenia fusiformis TaxID=6347 RepID=A0A8J1UEX4_OWEFU|nr:unnamed protein product [Owenia fusiformis]
MESFNFAMMAGNLSNSSDGNFSFNFDMFKLESDTSIITFTILSTILCATAIIANFATMLIVIFLPKQTPFTKLFVNLAICDILGTLAIYVGDVAFRAGTHWNVAIETCNMLFKIGGTCFSLFFFTSAVTLLVFAIMRFIGITKPHSFKPLFESTKKVALYIVLCWFISLCFTLPTIVCDKAKQRCSHLQRQAYNREATFGMDSNLVGMPNISTENATYYTNAEKDTSSTPIECMTKGAYTFCANWKYIWAGGKALILVIVVCLYLSLSRDLFVRTASFRSSTKSKNDDSIRDSEKDKHAFITILILLVILVSTGVPYIAVKVYRSAHFDQNIISVYNNFITYFPYINFILDPIVYSIRSPDINAKYRSIFGQIFCSERSHVQNGNTTTDYTVVSNSNDNTVTMTMNDNQTKAENDSHAPLTMTEIPTKAENV